MIDLKTDSQDCAEFQSHLAELLGEGQELSTHPHVTGCANCAELVRDLQYIAQQAKLLLPLHDPSPEVWERIESNLQPGASDGA